MKSFLAFLALPLQCLALTEFYVDPDWIGAHSGAANQPWNAFSTTERAAVNSALESDSVTVYFSAFKADGTTHQSQAWFVNPTRSAYSGNRLTFDGYSYYNASIVTPSWIANPHPIGSAYTNSQVFRLTGDGSQALGWSRSSGNDTVSNGGLTYYCIRSHLSSTSNEPGTGANWTDYWDQHGTGGSAWSSGTAYKCLTKQDNVTLRGFEITGSSARSGFNGDNFIWEYIYVHDITTDGAGVTLLYTSYPDSSAAAIISRPSTNITLRNFRIADTYGEGLYLGAINPSAPVDFQASHGNQHSGLLITNAVIAGSGFYGAQGDGIDCKNGLTDLHIVNVEIYGFTSTGISLPYSAVNVNQNILVERCFVHDGIYTPAQGNGACYSAETGGALSTTLYGMVGLTIRNCIAAKSHYGIRVLGSTARGQPVDHIGIYNNTVYGITETGLYVADDVTNAKAENNFVFNCADPVGNIIIGAVADYNAHDGSWTSPSEGAHTLELSTAQAEASIVSTNLLDFRLTANSALKRAAVTLAGFVNDFSGSQRSTPWDIGAYSRPSESAVSQMRVGSLKGK